ncbi:hypothetical protein STSP2_01208 [Anaerohalosphaera lusitana]|uniref:Uncharacterized protein n=1 Tax=Anaerohalosphaera lusitana TaxID=1936003 RepID=A0A1U9NJE3_9BACT|nr:hypothetical protein STSP2_01208 [Anaerohalosphaera lusitana]
MCVYNNKGKKVWTVCPVRSGLGSGTKVVTLGDVTCVF